MNFLISPEEMKRLRALAFQENEVSGACLYLRGGDAYIAGTAITGNGDSARADKDRKAVDALNGFLNANPQYGFIEFHMHTAGARKKFEQAYKKAGLDRRTAELMASVEMQSHVNSFSPDDVEAIADGTARCPSYTHMLVAPNGIRFVRYEFGRLVELPLPTIRDDQRMEDARLYLSKRMKLLE